MKRITFFVLLLLWELTPSAQNLVINPGFDSWISVTKPSGWVHVENCIKDSAFFNSGDYSCKHSGGVSGSSDLGQTISVSAGKRYTLSLFYKTVITSTGNGARIWCYWKDIAGNSIADQASDAILRPSGYFKSDTWKQFSITVSAPPEAASFYLEVRTYTNSVTYWDDFVFEENISTFNPEEKYPGIIIYPNPVSDYLTISNIQNIKRIEITNLTGKTFRSLGFSGETKVTIPVSGIPDGIYIINMQSGDKHLSRKFIRKSFRKR
jgi:hypothetical protein